MLYLQNTFKISSLISFFSPEEGVLTYKAHMCTALCTLEATET